VGLSILFVADQLTFFALQEYFLWRPVLHDYFQSFPLTRYFSAISSLDGGGDLTKQVGWDRVGGCTTKWCVLFGVFDLLIVDI